MEETSKIPRHVAIVMDGNGRWARQRGLPRLAGHRAGAKNTQTVLRACQKFDIRVITLYGFSTENWRRPRDEVMGLFRIFEKSIGKYTQELHRNGVQLRHLGCLERLPESLVKRIEWAVELTKDNDRFILNFAFNYGGRAEIVDATKRIIEAYRQGKIDLDALDEGLFERYLYMAGLPDVDLIIRAGGERRLSNFLLWQSTHAYFYSTPTYWPDFDEEELRKALVAYNRQRSPA
ncbi:MAG: polyprenyl diphosphate synthase [Chloroflexota bacterium]|nr:polyprenyl diphosphate synthase [Chloroflexota bacterium]